MHEWASSRGFVTASLNVLALLAFARDESQRRQELRAAMLQTLDVRAFALRSAVVRRSHQMKSDRPVVR